MAKAPKFIRDEILMYGGIVLALGASVPFLRFAANPVIEDTAELGAIALNAFFVAGGIAMFLYGLKFRRLENRLGKLHRALEKADRITVKDLARNLKVKPDDARKGVIYLIGGGHLPHRFDAKADAVVAPGVEAREAAAKDPQAVGWFKLPASCTGCGAPQQTMVPAGSEPRCEYCGVSLPAEFVPPPGGGKKAKAAAAAAVAAGAPAPAAPSSSGFGGSWLVLILLFIFFWPAAIFYLIAKLRKSGLGQVMPWR